jgi:diguanylate cyclase (GGDEF)-like protein
MWSGNALKRLDGSRWTELRVDEVAAYGTFRKTSEENWEITSARAPYYRATISVVPLDHFRALILLPDRILEFDAERSSSRTVVGLPQTGLTRFLAMRAARDGTIWLAGSGGVGRLYRKPARVADGSRDQDWQWMALPRLPLPWADFSDPIEGPGSGLFVIGTAASRERAALEFDGRKWEKIYASDSVARAWAGSGGSFWVQDGNRVLELAGGERKMVERSGVLAGTIRAVNSEGPGRFWVATSEGLALHATPLWSTPQGAPQVDDVVNAISEDRSGNLWFLAAHELIRFDNLAWSSFALPKGETAWAVYTEGPGVLPDGRLVILTTSAHWLAFDPARHTFQAVEHPDRRVLREFIQCPDGKLIAETYPAGSSSGMTLESFDGHRFLPVLGSGYFNDLRNMRLRPNGEIWAGGNSFVGVYRDSPGGPRAVKFGPADGYHDPGAYYIFDDPAGPLLVGGQDGLYQKDGEKWRLIRSGLNRVRNMVRSRDGTLWLASGTGIHRYHNGIWITNGLEEGLPSSVAYKVFEDSKGRIWAGTTRGLSLFNPGADGDAPLVAMDDDKNPREAPPGGKTRFQFYAVDRWKLTLPGRPLFSYRLDGGPWTSFEPADSASYDKLPAGSHRFEVRAMDRNGNISAHPVSRALSVLLPWYATPGFRWLATGAVFAIVALLTLALRSYKHRGDLIRRLNRTNKLERDRQTILEMIARREPLPQVARRIADCVAENCPESACALILEDKSIHAVFCTPALPQPLRQLLETSKGDTTSRWWLDIDAVARDYFSGPNRIVPIRAGDDEVLGAVALFYRQATGDADEYGGVPETFAAIAAAAIESARLYESLAYQARHDALTGLPNRLSFDCGLRNAVAKAGESRQTLSVFYIDLDRFKQINDTLGHRVGDLFLMQVANRLHSALDGEGTLARVGGDEFTVLIERGAGKASAHRVATAMLDSLRPPIRIEGHDLFAGASVGISFFPADGDTPVGLQKSADIAMYRAKARGRNCVEFFSAEMASVTEAAMDIEQILRRALEDRGFEMYYQPQFSLSGALVGFEALLRLNDAERGSISPDVFFPIAEETGLIVPIGARVLRDVCRQLREWLDEGLPVVKMAVTVSALEIMGDAFADGVAMALEGAGVDPHLLEFELTESAIARNPAEATRQMRKLRELGIRLAIDDFGTGYSSFASLQNLPLDALKIDRSFLAGTASAAESGQMMRTIVDLGRNMGLTVVAEGVETEAQLAMLRQSQCDVVQGYLLGRPQPAAQARAFLVAASEESPVGVG